MNNTLVQPIITEKSMQLAGVGWFTFKVEVQSTKPQIAQAVSEQFKVNVTDVKTVTMPGKSKKTGRKRIQVQAKPWKKAMVQLKKDQKIDLFSVGETPQK